MNLEQAQAELNTAIDAYGAARQQLAYARFSAASGMGGANLPFCEMQAHTKYHAMVRAHERFAALQPAPAPKPVVAPVKSAPVLKAVAAHAEIAPPVAAPTGTTTTASTAGSFDLLGHLNDRCEESEDKMWMRLGFPPVRRFVTR